MTSLVLATAMCASLLGAEAPAAETYAAAHTITAKTGKPMVIMVSTDWCGPCQNMKRTVLPEVRKHGFFKKVAFAMVNADREGGLARKLTGGGPVPQLVMYRKTTEGWKRRKLVGGKSVETVEEFISQGLAQDEAEKKATEETSKTRPVSETN